jgi:hypothetical protein
MRIKEILIKETATAGATSSGNIATVVSPHIAIGPDRFKTSYTGTPGRIRQTSTTSTQSIYAKECQWHC